MTGKMSRQAISDASGVPAWSEDAASRLKAAVRQFGSQDVVASRAGIARPSLSKILNGESRPKYGTLIAICEVIGADPEQIVGDGYGRPERALGNVNHDNDMIQVREIDLTFGMGGATYLEIPVTSVMHELPRDFVRSFSKAQPEMLFFARGIGDSMEPTIHDSDLLLIDASQSIMNVADKIWAIAFGGLGMIKRLRPRKGGGYMIMSDNSSVAPFDAVQDELAILGRVVAVVKKL